jgi:SAM-dependent methyltransferase
LKRPYGATMADVPYKEEFFAYHEQASRQSAREAIPLVFQFVQPSSLVDVGCGIGTWLAEFKVAGVSDYLGIDGNYVNRGQLVIDPERFLARDLTLPLKMDRRFDLAMSLEVAEHLPATSAETFVASLVQLAPVVLFSAAIPYQGGDGHVNEQWPDYWREKFARHDYVVIDCLRESLWMNRNVSPWYRQNLLFFVERNRLGNYPRLAGVFERAGADRPLSLVHPDHYVGLHLHVVKEMQCMAMRAALKLREINLLVFPDWRHPENVLRDQLRTLFAAILAHPDGQRIALIIDLGQEYQQLAGNLAAQLMNEVFARGGVLLPNAPGVSAVSHSFSPEEWAVLLACIQGRLVMPIEDSGAIVTHGVGQVPTLSLSTIQLRQPLMSK